MATHAEPEQETVAPADFKLPGVTSGPDGAAARIATSGKENRSLLEGEEIDGWKVEALESSSVTLGRDGKRMMLTIFNSDAPDTKESDTVDGTDGGIVFGPADDSEPAERKSPRCVIQSKRNSSPELGGHSLRQIYLELPYFTALGVLQQFIDGKFQGRRRQ